MNNDIIYYVILSTTAKRSHAAPLYMHASHLLHVVLRSFSVGWLLVLQHIIIVIRTFVCEQAERATQKNKKGPRIETIMLSQ